MKEIEVYFSFPRDVAPTNFASNQSTMPNSLYMDSQKELAWSICGILTDWLVQVHIHSRLMPHFSSASTKLTASSPCHVARKTIHFVRVVGMLALSVVTDEGWPWSVAAYSTNKTGRPNPLVFVIPTFARAYLTTYHSYLTNYTNFEAL
jgi:hypothetical protein